MCDFASFRVWKLCGDCLTYLGEIPLVGVKTKTFEAWSPFNLASGSEEGAAKDSCYSFDPLRFSNLIDGMAEAVKNLNFDLAVKPVQNSLAFQYLVNVLEVDLLLRLNLYKETLNWSLLRESVMNLLLVYSLPTNFKGRSI
ncbi:negative regulator of systemic acquired resistance SNI1-like isoform X2 [Zingiber officinale]|uniref:negative regulator of systemic acquired resistance SNI1-like isoform X2 n=1 Tax=Zingiber officinale TaxID=94328 RepID=UPI001C4B225C|nr:negative regulator of systemic acquired resistance SNI1-like isoform X2 [Zingiber officinale]